MALEEKRKVVALPEEREEMGRVINSFVSRYGSVGGMQLVEGRADKIRIRDAAAVEKQLSASSDREEVNVMVEWSFVEVLAMEVTRLRALLKADGGVAEAGADRQHDKLRMYPYSLAPNHANANFSGDRRMTAAQVINYAISPHGFAQAVTRTASSDLAEDKVYSFAEAETKISRTPSSGLWVAWGFALRLADWAAKEINERVVLEERHAKQLAALVEEHDAEVARLLEGEEDSGEEVEEEEVEEEEDGEDCEEEEPEEEEKDHLQRIRQLSFALKEKEALITKLQEDIARRSKTWTQKEVHEREHLLRKRLDAAVALLDMLRASMRSEPAE